MKTFPNIEDFLKDFKEPVNELWITDSVALKNLEIKKLLPSSFHPKICQSEDIISLLKNFFCNNKKVVLNNFERELFLKKVLSSKKYKGKYDHFENYVHQILDCIDTIRSFPSVKLEKEIKNSIVSKIIFEIKDIYEKELLKSEFTDDISLREELIKIDSFEMKKYDRIVFYGSFFNLIGFNSPTLGS